MNNQANPYSAPDSTFIDLPRPPASALNAILIGEAIDIVGGNVLNTVFTFCYGWYLASTGKSTGQILGIWATLSLYSGFSIFCMTVGCGTSIAGGFVCTRMAQRSGYKLGIIMGCISATLNLLMSYAKSSMMENIVLTLLTFACVMMGVHFGRVSATDH